MVNFEEQFRGTLKKSDVKFYCPFHVCLHQGESSAPALVQRCGYDELIVRLCDNGFLENTFFFLLSDKLVLSCSCRKA